MSLADLLLYLTMIVLGSIIGNKLLKRDREYKWISRIQTIAIIILIFTMGMRIGANDQVIQSLREIGTSAFIITAFSLVGSVLAVFLVRKLLGLNRRGVSKHD